MDNQSGNLSEAMRKLAERRDQRLPSSGPSISPDRLRWLHATLAYEFPVEKELRSAADGRDKSLKQRPVLRPPVEPLLHRRLSGQRPNPVQPASQQWWAASVRTFWATFRTNAQFATALVLIALSVGALKFGSLNKIGRPTLNSRNTPRPYFAKKAGGEPASEGHLKKWLPRNSSDELTLRVSTIELASLQPSLLRINRALLAERPDFDRSLPLDLPIRQILLDAAATATP